MMFINVSHR